MDNCLHKSGWALISPNQPHYHTLRQTSSHSRPCSFFVRTSADSQMDNIWKTILFPVLLLCMRPLEENVGQRKFLKSMLKCVSLNTSLHHQHITNLSVQVLQCVFYRTVDHFLKEHKVYKHPSCARQLHFQDLFTVKQL